MLFLTIWPLFALICLGFVLHRSGFPDPAFWPAAEKINYWILFPALLLTSLANAPVHDPELLRLGTAVVLTILMAALGLTLARAVRPVSAARFGPAMQGVVRFNTYLGLAVTVGVAGAEGRTPAAVLLAVAVPLVNVLSILALSDRGSDRSLTRLAGTILRNPLILACVAGIALAASGLGLPYGLDDFLGFLARASLPLGLLCVGAALRLDALRRDAGLLLGLSALRLFVMPMLAYGVAGGLGLGTTETLVLVIFSAIPTATTAYVLTRQMGGDGTLMAGLITAQTLAALISIPLVLGWLTVS